MLELIISVTIFLVFATTIYYLVSLATNKPVKHSLNDLELKPLPVQDDVFVEPIDDIQKPVEPNVIPVENISQDEFPSEGLAKRVKRKKTAKTEDKNIK